MYIIRLVPGTGQIFVFDFSTISSTAYKYLNQVQFLSLLLQAFFSTVDSDG